MTASVAPVASSAPAVAPGRPGRRTVEVLAPGLQTTVQDLPGRTGLWSVGVPPSGAWDDLSAGLANLAVGNPRRAACLEAVVQGPVLRFAARTLVCVTGSAVGARVDGRPVAAGRPVIVPAGGVLDVGPLPGPGMRAYVTVAGGFDVPLVLGSRSTFTLGGFGGHEGRPLAAGDELAVHDDENCTAPSDVRDRLPVLGGPWTVRVVPGPHGAPAHLTPEGVDALFGTAWTVDHRADRTGVRLVGPRPLWARADGGDAGLHPSNVHDSAYAMGAVMLSGDTPVVVGPDGPSLGGFVVAAVVVEADRWVLAQARPGDVVRLVPVTPEQADAAVVDRLSSARRATVPRASSADRPPALLELAASGSRPALVVRPAGDRHVLVELGPAVLDLAVRLQVHLLARELSGLPGLVEQVEGVRSLLLGTRTPLSAVADAVASAWERLPDPADVVLPVREVELPLSLDDPAAHEAMARYHRGVRADAPWSPDNVEFIRRVNGLAERDDVFRIVTEATYLVIGLGDVYLGAPVAVPMDPRHRLVTTKYDPPRTWTPANAVGIGGVYLCVYGMEGPGGYQLVGRTVPVWRLDPGGDEPPWLLRHFDRLRFRPVSAEELLDLRADLAAGRTALTTRAATLTLADLVAVDADSADEASAFTARRQEAFAAERSSWGVRA